MIIGGNPVLWQRNQLQEKGNQVGSAGTPRESPRIRRNTKEVGLTGTNARQNWLDCLEQDAPRYQ